MVSTCLLSGAPAAGSQPSGPCSTPPTLPGAQHGVGARGLAQPVAAGWQEGGAGGRVGWEVRAAPFRTRDVLLTGLPAGRGEMAQQPAGTSWQQHAQCACCSRLLRTLVQLCSRYCLLQNVQEPSMQCLLSSARGQERWGHRWHAFAAHIAPLDLCQCFTYGSGKLCIHCRNAGGAARLRQLLRQLRDTSDRIGNGRQSARCN